MADGFGFGQVDGGDLVGGEEDAVATVAADRPDGDAFAPEGLRHFPQAALKADVILGRGNGPHDLVLAIVDLGQLGGEGARARPVAVGGDGEADAFVRPLEIIDLAPGVERALRLLQAVKGAQREDLVRQRPMEALVPMPSGIAYAVTASCNRAEPRSPGAFRQPFARRAANRKWLHRRFPGYSPSHHKRCTDVDYSGPRTRYQARCWA